jgi:hypothetical protein
MFSVPSYYAPGLLIQAINSNYRKSFFRNCIRFLLGRVEGRLSCILDPDDPESERG